MLLESIKYKVGSHNGTLNKLVARYITALPQLRINYFIYHEDAINIERKFNNLFYDYRLINKNGITSEWFIMPLNNIITNLSNIISKSNVQYQSFIYKETCVILPSDNNEILHFNWRKYIENKTLDNNISRVTPNNEDTNPNKDDEELVRKLRLELGDKFKYINITELPEGHEYDSHRELLRAMNRIKKRNQRIREKIRKSTNIVKLQSLLVRTAAYQRPILNHTIVTSSGCIMEVIPTYI